MLMDLLISSGSSSWLPLAYVGPGAGFALVGSFALVVAAVAMAVLAMLIWPFRLAMAALAGIRRKRAKTDTRRIIIVGLDGLDPRRCEALMAAGRLPNLGALRDKGSFRRLATTCPPISPVAP